MFLRHYSRLECNLLEVLSELLEKMNAMVIVINTDHELYVV